MGRGRERGPQAGTSGVQGRVYAITPQAKSADHPVIQGTFLLSLSRLDSRSDPIGGSEPVFRTRDHILGLFTLFFFFKSQLEPVGMAHIL